MTPQEPKESLEEKIIVDTFRVLNDGFECTGRYCHHETSEKHYVVEKSFIEQSVRKAISTALAQREKELMEAIVKKQFELNRDFGPVLALLNKQ